MNKRTTNDERRTTIRFLGTNGWYDTDTGNTICILIETPKEYVVLDAGNGIYKLDKYITDERKPIYLFLSHLHLDHVAGLHILAKFRFSQGIQICVPRKYSKHLKNFLKQPLTAPIEKLLTRVWITELKEKNNPIRFLQAILPLYHVADCYGYRLKFGRKVISYVPDTGVCDNAYKLAKHADLLIAECAFKPDYHEEGWPHLNPETAAEIARDAKAKKLLLVHFDAAIYRSLKERKIAEKQAQKIFKNTLTTKDDQIEVLS